MINLAIRQKVKVDRPLIHCITNPISINDCANAVLAVGAKPIMAEHPKEVEQITENAGALAVNLGNITDVRMESMMLSGAVAHRKRIPQVIDVVGVACSDFRLGFAKKYIAQNKPQVIKGNASEIKAYCGISTQASGIDTAAADEIQMDSVKRDIRLFQNLAKETGAVILISGKTDLVVSQTKAYTIHNGVSMLADITGTGCVLNALTAAFLSQGIPVEAALLATVLLGIAGQLAETDKGTGSFRTALMDALGTVDDSTLLRMIQVKEV